MIRSFSGKHAFLSNLYKSKFTINGSEYNTVEHFYAASKALNPIEHEIIRHAETPAEAKKLGRQLKNIRPDWDNARLDVMRVGLRAKFEQNPKLAKLLIDTGDLPLVEANL